MSLHKPFSDLVGSLLGTGDIRSIFCLVVFCIVFLVLAYLTNPSENSFRAYLTEQSFRQHLSRLDDAIDDDSAIAEKPDSSSSFRRGPSSGSRSTLAFDNRSPFHFANRASVSLRTPKHVFHSFGIFTIAAMIPLVKTSHDHRHENDGSMISDSWYIGAFGKWWRGGFFDAWYQDVIARSTDEDSWSSGILGMKTLDRTSYYNALPGLPFSNKNLPPHGLSRGTPPRLRNRDKSSQRSSLLSTTRSASPPPLPKSASLPLHVSRPSQSSGDRKTIQTPPQSSRTLPENNATGETLLSTPIVSPSPPALFDQSPRVVEMLRQISKSKASVVDLCTQLRDLQSAAAASHGTLQEELDMHRERKRQEDAARIDLKTRTKTLDEAKRTAEGLKKDAEKRLKVAQSARDDASQRMEHFDKEISLLQQRLAADEVSISQSKDGVLEEEKEIKDALDLKRKEIKVAEEVISALNLRSRELEEKLSSEKERLRAMRERAEEARKQNGLLSLSLSREPESSVPWPSIPHGMIYDGGHGSNNQVSLSSGSGEYHERSVGANGRFRHSSDPRSLPSSPRPAKLALGNISNFNRTCSINGNGNDNLHGTSTPASFVVLQPQPPLTTNFSRFAESIPSIPSPVVTLSPTSTQFIPAGLMNSLDSSEGVSRSFQSENDAFLDRDWRNNNLTQTVQRHPGHDDRSSGHANPLTSSPLSVNDPLEPEHDPFEVHVYSQQERERFRLNSDNLTDRQRVSTAHRNNSDPTSDMTPTSVSVPEDVITNNRSSTARRWFSTSSKERPKKGLNPDAKVFDMPHKSQGSIYSAPNPAFRLGGGVGSATTFDALNPNGLGSSISIVPSTASNSSFLRAFALSPAEREKLRVLGGSANASLERLPSLSDVGSIPPSPSHIHAHAIAQPHGQDSVSILKPNIGAWLQTLPRIRKPNFSPWDDEELVDGL